MSSTETKREQGELEKIIIRSYPKVIAIIPSAVMAVIFGIVEWFVPTLATTLGLAFIALFLFNVLVMAFEFDEMKTLALIFLIVIIVLLYIVFSPYMPVTAGAIGKALLGLNLTFSPEAFLAIGIGTLFILFLVWLSRRWNYWIIEPNQISHRVGLFGKVERFSTTGMRYHIEISDVFEYLIFGCGKVTFFFPTERKAITLEMVPHVKKVDQLMGKLLGIIEVEPEEVMGP
ncbi:MAG: hypothetical protein ACTSXJ_04340 [Candidatus Baldrarchaeia archaeon]